MSKKLSEFEFPAIALKNDSSRQRWELFHRAIAHAKESSNSALLDEDEPRGGETEGSAPLLTVVR